MRLKTNLQICTFLRNPPVFPQPSLLKVTVPAKWMLCLSTLKTEPVWTNFMITLASSSWFKFYFPIFSFPGTLIQANLLFKYLCSSCSPCVKILFKDQLISMRGISLKPRTKFFYNMKSQEQALVRKTKMLSLKVHGQIRKKNRLGQDETGKRQTHL